MTDLDRHVRQPGRDKLVKQVRAKINELGVDDGVRVSKHGGCLLAWQITAGVVGRLKKLQRFKFGHDEDLASLFQAANGPAN